KPPHHNSLAMGEFPLLLCSQTQRIQSSSRVEKSMAKPTDIKSPPNASQTGQTAETQAEEQAKPDEDRDLVLTHREAEAGGPPDGAACGEEDPGSGLEFLVTRGRKR